MKLRQPMPELTGAKEWLNGEVTKEQLIGEKPTLIHFGRSAATCAKRRCRKSMSSATATAIN